MSGILVWKKDAFARSTNKTANGKTSTGSLCEDGDFIETHRVEIMSIRNGKIWSWLSFAIQTRLDTQRFFLDPEIGRYAAGSKIGIASLGIFALNYRNMVIKKLRCSKGTFLQYHLRTGKSTSLIKFQYMDKCFNLHVLMFWRAIKPFLEINLCFVILRT